MRFRADMDFFTVWGAGFGPAFPREGVLEPPFFASKQSASLSPQGLLRCRFFRFEGTDGGGIWGAGTR
ncbi:hypothetical protein MBUL_01219 [Methylobacterium bullatum]|uniref:Uncharacterized protein n=1 Tax=Methylobacterium bullatum TaxID=570505 RepID=A0A679IZ19_9HYPH|nr:hypothetical protein MBUL_01219 [Methylobacterium bullatum]